MLNPRREEHEIFDDSEEADRLRSRHARFTRDKATQTDRSSSLSFCCGVCGGVFLVACLIVCLLLFVLNDIHKDGKVLTFLPSLCLCSPSSVLTSFFLFLPHFHPLCPMTDEPWSNCILLVLVLSCFLLSLSVLALCGARERAATARYCFFLHLDPYP